MAKRLLLYPYKMGSKSGKLMSSALECKRVFPDKEYTPKANDVVINWGNGYAPSWRHDISRARIVNHWQNVGYAVDKLESFRRFETNGVRMPDITASARKAQSWLEDDEFVVGRQTLEGKDGDGIIFMKERADFVECRLYTKYIKKVTEYRIYTMNGKVIDCLEKRRDTDALEAGKVDPYIRTERNGWCFCRQGVVMPEPAAKEAVKAVTSLGLVFGGVDVIWNPQHNRAYVLEVNTAPSIFGPTIRRYANAFREYAESL